MEWHDDETISRRISRLELTSGFKLKKEQIEHIQRIVNIIREHPFAIDASMMGLGKTIMTLVISKIFKKRLIIIAPNITHNNWQQRAEDFGVTIWTMIGYDSMKSESSSLTYKKIEDGATAYFPTQRFIDHIKKRGFFLVFDECQRLKNDTVQSSIGCLIAKTLRDYNNPENPSKMFLLSGTLLDKDESLIQYSSLLGLCSTITKFSTTEKKRRDTVETKSALKNEIMVSIFNKNNERAINTFRDCDISSQFISDIIDILASRTQLINNHTRSYIAEIARTFGHVEWEKIPKQTAKLRKFINSSGQTCTRIKERIVLDDEDPVNTETLITFVIQQPKRIALKISENGIPPDTIEDFVHATTAYFDEIEDSQIDYNDKLRKHFQSTKITPQKMTKIFFQSVYLLIYSECDVPASHNVKGYNVFYPVVDKKDRRKYRQRYNEINKVVKETDGTLIKKQTNIARIFRKMQSIKTRMLGEIIYNRVKSDIEKGIQKKYALICFHTKNIQYLQEKLKEFKPLVVYGEIKSDSRQPEIERFQRDNGKYRIFIGGISVISVGIDLDDKTGSWPRELWILPTYYIIYQQQAIYRIKRMNTASEAYVYFLYVEHEDIDDDQLIEKPETRLITKILQGCDLLRMFHPKQASVQKFPGHYPEIHYQRAVTKGGRETFKITERESLYGTNKAIERADMAAIATATDLFVSERKRELHFPAQDVKKIIDTLNDGSFYSKQNIANGVENYTEQFLSKNNPTEGKIDFQRMRESLKFLNAWKKSDTAKESNELVRQTISSKYGEWDVLDKKVVESITSLMASNSDYNAFIFVQKSNKLYKTTRFLKDLVEKGTKSLVLKILAEKGFDQAIDYNKLFLFSIGKKSYEFADIFAQYSTKMSLADTIESQLQEEPFDENLCQLTILNAEDIDAVDWVKFAKGITRKTDEEKVRIVFEHLTRDDSKPNTRYLDLTSYFSVLFSSVNYGFAGLAKDLLYLDSSNITVPFTNNIVKRLKSKESFQSTIIKIKRFVEFLVSNDVHVGFIQPKKILEVVLEKVPELTKQNYKTLSVALKDHDYFEDSTEDEEDSSTEDSE